MVSVVFRKTEIYSIQKGLFSKRHLVVSVVLVVSSGQNEQPSVEPKVRLQGVRLQPALLSWLLLLGNAWLTVLWGSFWCNQSTVEMPSKGTVWRVSPLIALIALGAFFHSAPGSAQTPFLKPPSSTSPFRHSDSSEFFRISPPGVSLKSRGSVQRDEKRRNIEMTKPFCTSVVTCLSSSENSVSAKGVFWKGVLSEKSMNLEILEDVEILETAQTVESKGESDHFLEILENLEILEIPEFPPVKRPLS